jgi:hypothetical protein
MGIFKSKEEKAINKIKEYRKKIEEWNKLSEGVKEVRWGDPSGYKAKIEEIKSSFPDSKEVQKEKFKTEESEKKFPKRKQKDSKKYANDVRIVVEELPPLNKYKRRGQGK